MACPLSPVPLTTSVIRFPLRLFLVSVRFLLTTTAARHHCSLAAVRHRRRFIARCHHHLSSPPWFLVRHLCPSFILLSSIFKSLPCQLARIPSPLSVIPPNSLDDPLQPVQYFHGGSTHIDEACCGKREHYFGSYSNSLGTVSTFPFRCSLHRSVHDPIAAMALSSPPRIAFRRDPDSQHLGTFRLLCSYSLSSPLISNDDRFLSLPALSSESYASSPPPQYVLSTS